MNRDACVDTAVSDYREFPPPSALASYLLCLWTQRIVGSRGEFSQRVLPDGCIDIVLINDEAPVVVGPWTEPFVARLVLGTMIVGARFHPGCAPGLLGLPASALLNQSVTLRSMWGGAASARFARIASESTLPTRTLAMESALLERLAQAHPVDERMRAAIQWLGDHPHGRIERLSQRIGISSRQLQRRFTRAVGYGPKMFQSVLRFQRLLNLSGGTEAPRNLAQISSDAGYADQAHMTREVRRFSGTPPTVLLPSARCALGLSDLVRKTEHMNC
ncbi:MAG TPA: AraC family transcriptional regulator [Candidatus Dormibacteraeota bacterium]|jgi:AraC-like DNA-binding protein|nr:AraC family transcriptional regulator [Candidatus Dormibacteraeota bacterium]